VTQASRLAVLSLALIALSACGTEATPDPATAPPTDPPASAICTTAAGPAATEVSIAGFAFDPGTARARVGESIAWTNADGAPHTATLDGGECTTPNIGRDETAFLSFTVPGTYRYHCRIHPDMTGRIEIEG
jgi:plastocyanin